MPKIITFNGRQIIEPGAYSTIKSGVALAPIPGSTGNVLLIDTGSGAGYGWGAGVNGELEESGDGVIYQFDNPEDAKRAMRGGILFDLMDFLWNPSTSLSGIQSLFYMRAATTTAATYVISSPDLGVNAGAMTFAARNEGTGGNGTIDTTGEILQTGYGFRIRTGIIDPTKVIFEFFEGQYRGKDADGIEYDISIENVSNYLLTRSTEVSNIEELMAWAKDDFLFNQYFKIVASTASTANITVATALSNFGDIQPFNGGTTEYNSLDVDTALGIAEDLDNSLILCDDYGIASPTSDEALDGANKGARSAANYKILAYARETSTYTEKILFIGGGKNNNEFDDPSNGNGTLQIAKDFDNMLVVVPHSDIGIASRPKRWLPTIYHAAMVCGITAGLPSQIPVTYKPIRINAVRHSLKKSQREKALLGGVLHQKYVPTMGFVVNQGINTLQRNQNLYNSDGTSPEISIVRIFHQMNKELIINGTPRFTGTNLNTSSSEDVVSFTKGYLNSKVATRMEDNLIISFNSIKAILDQDVWKVTYCVIINGPINRTFFTGFALDPNISI